MIAERFANFLESDEKLKFDYEEIIDPIECPVPAVPILAESIPAPVEKKVNNALSLSELQALEDMEENGDADEIYKIESSESEENSEEESDELSGYDLEDDESDLQKIRSPVYIGDCLRLLKDSDNADSIEVGLGAAEKIISRNPDDLFERSVEFCRTLLYLQSSLHSDLLVEQRKKALIALTVQCPSPVVKYLTDEFYGNNHTIQNRLDILHILIDAATQLTDISYSNPIGQNVEHTKPSENPFEIVGDFATDGFRKQFVGRLIQVRESPSELSEKILQRTRKWGSINKTVQTSKKNRFEPVAGEFFFPLIQRFDNKKLVFFF